MGYTSQSKHLRNLSSANTLLVEVEVSSNAYLSAFRWALGTARGMAGSCVGPTHEGGVRTRGAEDPTFLSAHKVPTRRLEYSISFLMQATLSILCSCTEGFTASLQAPTLGKRKI